MTSAELNIRMLLAVVVVILAVQVIGWLTSRAGQPRVIGEIIAGVLLGPSLLGLLVPGVSAYLFPGPVVDGLRILSQFGLALFMLLVGMHLDLPFVRASGRTVAVVAQASIVVPFGLAVGLAALAYPVFGEGVDPVPFCVFLGSAMAVTALPVLARLLVEVGLHRNRVGAIALAASAINDVIAWCLVALVAALHGSARPGGAALTLGLALPFFAVMVFVVRPLLARWEQLPMWAVLVVTIGSAWVAEQVGIHAIIGAFAAGVAMPRRQEWLKQIDDRLDVIVRNLLLPIFFVVAGLSARVDQLASAAWLLLAAVTVVATVGKLGAATIAARIAGERWADSVTLGILMNTRGITELVILSIGLQLGIISTTVYTVMVLMALFTTLMAAPLLALVRRRTGVAGAPDPGRDALRVT
jgi:Kef-type K+ transport system membrane component KefB